MNRNECEPDVDISLWHHVFDGGPIEPGKVCKCGKWEVFMAKEVGTGLNQIAFQKVMPA
jgi:hypothetical protein